MKKQAVAWIVTVMMLVAGSALAGGKGTQKWSGPGGQGGGIVLPPMVGGTVEMPWVEFAKLLGALEKDGEPAPPPVAWAVEEAAYACTVDPEGERATIEARYSVQVIQQGWTMVDLVRGEVAVDEFDATGADVSLAQTWNQVSAIVEGPASFEVEMTLSKKVGADHGMKTLHLDGPPAVSARLDCSVSGEGLEIKVEPGIIEKQSAKDGRVDVSASLYGTGSFDLRWWEEVKIPESEEKDLPVKIYGEVDTLLKVGEGMIRGTAWVNYSILQAGVQELRILVPDDIAVIDVQGTDLASWEVRDTEGTKVLHAFLAYKVKNDYGLVITWDKSMGETSAVVDVPRMRLLGVERETGTFGVEVFTNVEVKLESYDNMAQVDGVELPDPVQWAAEHPVLLGFKYLEHPYALTLEVEKHADVPVLVATVDVADVTTLLTEDGKVLTRVVLSMRNNMKQFLKVGLPDDSEVWSTYVAGKPVKPGQDDDGRILVPLEKSSPGAGSTDNFPVEIIYLTTGESLANKGEHALDLCTFDLPLTYLQWSVYLPEKYKYKKFGGNVDTWEGTFDSVPDTVNRDAYAVIEEAQVQMNVANDDYYQQAEIVDVQKKQSFSKGVLPVKMEVPEKGKLERFVKMLVIDESAHVTFKYRKPLKYR